MREALKQIGNDNFLLSSNLILMSTENVSFRCCRYTASIWNRVYQKLSFLQSRSLYKAGYFPSRRNVFASSATVLGKGPRLFHPELDESLGSGARFLPLPPQDRV